MRAALIVNPAAGKARALSAQLPALRTLLERHGYATDVVETTSAPGSTQSLAASAAQTSALVLACGGDGTVHAVVQALAHTGVAMGVLPLGTANALARNLGLPADPREALARLLTCEPRTIPLGHLATDRESRFFITMAGCGPSASLAERMAKPSPSKRRLGPSVYAVRAARLFLTQRWPAFEVSWRPTGETTWHVTQAVSLLISRVPDLGGAFARLTPASSVTMPSLEVHLLPAPAHLTLPAWFAAAAIRARNPWLTSIHADELRCTPLSMQAPLVQADAEPLGALPAHIRLIPGALRLMMPPHPPPKKLSS